MAAKVFTKEAAEKANLSLVEGGRGTQAVHDVIVAMRAARRSGSANTKTKAEVSFSGAKPWRQKGTGRARAGYKSSPIWRGGGVVFGPKPRSYAKKVPKSVRRLAFQKALSERIHSGDVLTIGTLSLKETKTKAFVSLLKEHTDARRILVVSDAFDDHVYRSARNVKPVQLATAAEVNTEQLLAFEKILITDAALSKLAVRTGHPAVADEAGEDKTEVATSVKRPKSKPRKGKIKAKVAPSRTKAKKRTATKASKGKKS